MHPTPGISFPGLKISVDRHRDGTATVTCDFVLLRETYQVDWPTRYPLAMDDFWSEILLLVRQVHADTKRRGYRPRATIPNPRRTRTWTRK